MKISTFQARDMREALKEVKEKLGPDAVILSTRSIRDRSRGGMGLGQTMIEVTACPSPAAREASVQSDGAPPVTPTARGSSRFSRVVDDPVDHPLSGVVGREAPHPAREPKRVAAAERYPARVTTPVSRGRPPVGADDFAQIEPDPRDLDDRLDTISSMPSGDVTGLDADGKRNYSWLLMHGVEEPIARRLATMEIQGGERGLVSVFKQSLKFRDPLDGKARVIALVGPTGVGKTTTLAKIAADLLLNRQRSVGMITLDTFRVGAVAQLETYAKLLQMRLVVARSLSEVKAGLSSLNRCDYVLVDTVGSSPYNRRQVNSTAGLLPVMGEDREVILCMAANVRETEQQAIFRRFSILKPTGLIFTKLDETVTYGGILNVAVKANVPLTMYTDGQRVPENLGWMSAQTLAKWFEKDQGAEE